MNEPWCDLQLGDGVRIEWVSVHANQGTVCLTQ